MGPTPSLSETITRNIYWTSHRQCQLAGGRGADGTWLNRIRNPSQTRDNILRYYRKFLDLNEFFLYCTFQTICEAADFKEGGCMQHSIQEHVSG